MSLHELNSTSLTAYLRHSVIRYLQRVVQRQQQIPRLDVLVDDSPPVQILQPVQQLDKVVVGLVHRQLSLRRNRVEHFLQPPDAVLHDEVHLLLFLVVQHVQQFDHVPVVQRPEQLDFAPDVLLAVGDAAEFALR